MTTPMSRNDLLVFDKFETSTDSRTLLLVLIEFLALGVKDPEQWPALETILYRAFHYSSDCAALRQRVEALEQECEDRKGALDKMLALAQRRAKVNQELTQQLAERDAELAKWQQPFDPVQFQLVKEQASHKDSLAAQGVYITALEHALKHRDARIARLEEALKLLAATGLDRLEDRQRSEKECLRDDCWWDRRVSGTWSNWFAQQALAKEEY